MPYNPNFYNNYYGNSNGNYMGSQNQTMQQIQPQIQNGGFVMVRSELEARNYPVAFGNSVTFKDETAPYIYSKTMGFSQLDRPIFEKYKLVKEETKDVASEPNTIDGIKAELNRMWTEIDMLKERSNEQHPKHNENVQHVSTKSDEDFIDAV